MSLGHPNSAFRRKLLIGKAKLNDLHAVHRSDPRPWLHTVPRVVIILIIVLVCAHAAPDGALPLALGGWLGSYLLKTGTTAGHGQRK